MSFNVIYPSTKKVPLEGDFFIVSSENIDLLIGSSF